MKAVLTIVVLCMSLSGIAQSNDEIRLLNNTRLLHKTVFETKDSLVLDNIFGSSVTYGHSSGKVENREEAIRGIIHSKINFVDLTIDGIQVQLVGNTAVTRHVMTANELMADNQKRPLKLLVLFVWVKERKEWKLMARQAVKI